MKWPSTVTPLISTFEECYLVNQHLLRSVFLFDFERAIQFFALGMLFLTVESDVPQKRRFEFLGYTCGDHLTYCKQPEVECNDAIDWPGCGENGQCCFL